MKKATSANYDYFLKTDTTPYKGQWIAIANKKIVAHGPDAQKVYKAAKRKTSAKDISLAKAPNEQILAINFV